jgi:hypothetical protein
LVFLIPLRNAACENSSSQLPWRLSQKMRFFCSGFAGV